MFSHLILDQAVGATTPLNTIDKDIINTNNDLKQQIDKISELLAFVAVYDPDTMINLNTWFEKIGELAANQYKANISTMAVAAAQISEELILENPTDQVSDATNQPDLIEKMQSHIKDRLAQILATMNTEK